MGATLTERYEMKDKGTKRLTSDFEKLRKDLKKVHYTWSVLAERILSIKQSVVFITFADRIHMHLIVIY